jgi:hypothetical protein
MIATRFPRQNTKSVPAAKSDPFLRLLRWTPFLALLIFMANVGAFQNARQLGPYYVFFFPLLLAEPRQAGVVRQRWWQWLGLGIMIFTAALLVLARNRPLFPAETIFTRLTASHPQSAALAKASEAYMFWTSTRNAENSPFKNLLPPDEPVVGYATLAGYAEPGLWLPFGTRTVERILRADTAGELRSKNIRYVVIGDEYFQTPADNAIEAWLTRYDGELVDQMSYDYGPGGPVRQLYLVRLR